MKPEINSYYYSFPWALGIAQNAPFRFDSCPPKSKNWAEFTKHVKKHKLLNEYKPASLRMKPTGSWFIWLGRKYVLEDL